MKIEKPAKPDKISIFVSGAHPDLILTDYRLVQRYGGLKFGTLGQVAQNLGISMKTANGGLIFSAPKARLQLFVEKLHFALIPYSQI